MIDDLRTVLLADGTVAGLASTRVYPVVMPQGGTLPALVLQVISGPRPVTLSGAVEPAPHRVQVDAWAETYAAAHALRAAAEAAVNGHDGTTGDTVFQFVGVEDRRDDYEPAREEGSSRYRASLDLIIWHRST